MQIQFASGPGSEGLLKKWFPIEKAERSKVIALCLFKALVSFLYTTLKIQKENNIVVNYGAEGITVPKLVVFFVSLGLVFLYTSLNNRYRQTQLFYGILGSFLVFFILYAFVLVPFGDLLRPSQDTPLRGWSTNNFWQVCVSLYIGWIDVFFFCIAELWGQFCIFILFWGLTNEICKRAEAKRVYHLFIASGCLGGLLGSGFVWLVYHATWYAAGIPDIYQTHPLQRVLVHRIAMVIGITGMVVVVLLALLYRWINANLYQDKQLLRLRDKKTKLSFWEALKHIFSDPILLATTAMVIGCAVTISLTDVTFRKYVQTSGRKGFRPPVEYADFKCQEIFWVNLLSTLTCLVIAPYIMRKFDWKVMAYLTPIIVLVSAGGFFVLSIVNKGGALDGLSQGFFGKTATQVICQVGLVQTILAIVSKYAFFDGTKEYVFIGMGQEARKKGKPAVDVVGSRLGKFLANSVHAFLFAAYNTKEVRNVTHILLIIFLAMAFAWLGSVRYLTKHLTPPKEDISNGTTKHVKR